jgi:hypothetical protein
VNAFNFQISDYAAPAELFIVAAKTGVCSGVICVAQIFLVLQSQDYHLHQQMAALVLGNALAHEPLQLGDGPHASTQ